jgi:hypothetical protein
VPTKYLPYFPKPLLDDLVKGRWLPVLGAGMSLNATLPPTAKMPLWSDLSKILSDELTDYSPSGVLDAISAYEHEYGRARLIERLVEILHLKDAQPGAAHREFCSLPFDIVCTTNFDFLLERQYDLIPQPVHPVVDEEQLSINIGSAGTMLLKLHGDLRHPNRLVVTEADYDGFLANYPLIATYLSNQLITKTAVLVGYSLDDPDFRQIWHVVTSRLGKTRRMAYAIVVNARPGDIARFERRGVKVVNLPGPKDKYGQILAEAFRELGEYLRDNIVSVSKVTEEEPLRELLLPRDATTRLCFFSLPLDVLPFYRERVFPIAEEAGFVPVTATDVITPGDSFSAKIDTLIDRAAVMVVELSSSWTRAELAMAIARNKQTDAARLNRNPIRLILVAVEGEPTPFLVHDFIVTVRPSLLSDESERFLEELRRTFTNLAHEVGVQRGDEPQRLLAQKEYRAAIIAAMTNLEATLRQRLEKGQWTDVRRPMALRSLVERAISADVIPQHSRDMVFGWMKLRNEAVHTSKPVTRTEAKAVVEGVERLLSYPLGEDL